MRPEALALAAAAAVAIVSSLSIPLPGLAQQWPDKSVRMLVPFPPGGGTDIQARLLSSAFQKSMGQNFIVDNRTGAGGLIATQLATESPPDGGTILFTSGEIRESDQVREHQARMT
jgi:tripartite-type tricarboxylate transporter receptor subunit TctC